ncbi:hypothetical protein Tco_0837907 [Tanacetum coccineum]
MKGTELSYQERECKLYNLFDKFAYVKVETLYEYYSRFSQLINDMHNIGMTMQQVQVNTKFLNALLSEWSKFVTDVKYPDPLTLVANSPTLYNPSQSPQHSDSLFLTVPMFQQGEDQIECINKAMAFLSAIASRFPPSNNQLRTSSNPRNRATIQDGIGDYLEGNVTAGPSRVVKCYTCQAEAQEAGQILDEEQLAFLADPGILEAPVAQQTIPQNLALQIDDLDAYDSNYDNIPRLKSVLMDTNPSAANDLLVLSMWKNTDHVVQIVLWYLDSGCSKHMTRNCSQLMNFVSKFLGTVRFENDQVAKIMGYGDYQQGNDPDSSQTPQHPVQNLVPNIIPQQPCNPPQRYDWDTLFQPLFDEYFNPPTIVVSTVLVANAPRAVDIVHHTVYVH